MSATYTNILNRVKQLTKADPLNIITDDDYTDLIDEAVAIFSNDKPLLKCVLKEADSTGFYSLPDDWNNSMSKIIEVESPINETPKSIIDQSYYCVDQYPTGYKLRFDLNNPTTSFYLRYTIPYSVEDDGSTNIPITDILTVAYKASAMCCQVLASHFATKTDNNIPELAEMVKYDDRCDQWNKRAASFNKSYNYLIKKKRRTTGIIGNFNEIENDENFFRRK